MLIRAATPSDVPQIIALAERCETAAHWSAGAYDALFASEAPIRIALIAVPQGNAIAGFAITRGMNDEGELENIVVAPEFRRQGIAQLLMSELLARARQSKATALLLEVRQSNVAALQLYAKLGFIEIGLRRGYYCDPPEDALLLRLPLQSGDKTP